MHSSYRAKLCRAVYGDGWKGYVANDPLAKDAANLIDRLRRQLAAVEREARADERERCIQIIQWRHEKDRNASQAKTNDVEMAEQHIAVAVACNELIAAIRGLKRDT